MTESSAAWRLYHYYESANGPFRNLSALGAEEARDVQHSLARRAKAFASRRADDYLDVRRGLERRAREQFVAKGGRPELAYPHYMTLGACDWLLDWYEEARLLSVPLREADAGWISFTYGDLFPTMRHRDGRPYREQVYTLAEIREVVAEFGWPQEWNKDGTNGPERYIEAQIWNEKELQAWIGNL